MTAQPTMTTTIGYAQQNNTGRAPGAGTRPGMSHHPTAWEVLRATRSPTAGTTASNHRGSG